MSDLHANLWWMLSHHAKLSCSYLWKVSIFFWLIIKNIAYRQAALWQVQDCCWYPNSTNIWHWSLDVKLSLIQALSTKSPFATKPWKEVTCIVSKPLAGVWFDKSIKFWKMGSGPGSPFGLEDKAPWTSWMFNFGGFTDSPQTRN